MVFANKKKYGTSLNITAFLSEQAVRLARKSSAAPAHGAPKSLCRQLQASFAVFVNARRDKEISHVSRRPSQARRSATRSEQCSWRVSERIAAAVVFEGLSP